MEEAKRAFLQLNIESMREFMAWAPAILQERSTCQFATLLESLPPRTQHEIVAWLPHKSRCHYAAVNHSWCLSACGSGTLRRNGAKTRLQFDLSDISWLNSAKSKSQLLQAVFTLTMKDLKISDHNIKSLPESKKTIIHFLVLLTLYSFILHHLTIFLNQIYFRHTL